MIRLPGPGAGDRRRRRAALRHLAAHNLGSILGVLVLLGWALGCRTEPVADRAGDPGAVSGAAASKSPVLEVTLRGHPEVDFEADGTLRPRLVDPMTPLTLCVRSTPETATAQWQLRVEVVGPGVGTAESDAASSAFRSPSGRLGTTLCVETTLPESARGFRDPASEGLQPVDLEVCGAVRDGFDGSTLELPCLPLRLRPDAGAREALDRELSTLLRQPPAGGLGPLVAALDTLAERARQQALPFFALRCELVAVHYLRRDGSVDALATAAARLAEPAPWLAASSAIGWRARWEYERALVALAQGWDLRAAWQHLGTAEHEAMRVLHPTRLTMRMKQAEILARVGALGEAIDRLSSALDDCATAPCNPHLLPSARGVLAWFVALDPLATTDDLVRAREHLEAALDAESADALERANQRLNGAMLALGAASDSEPDLMVARQVLTTAPPGTRTWLLVGWERLVTGLAQLEVGDPDALRTSLAACGAAVLPEFPRLAAWASDCLGRAHRRLGDLDAAHGAFEAARLLLDYATPERLGRAIALVPGRRAEVFYRSARLAVERGDSAGAWRLLAELDDRAVGAHDLARCRALDAESAEERDTLLANLAQLEGPASGRQREQRRSVRRALSERLEELVRGRPGCAELLVPHDDRGLVRRAFAVADEVLVLERQPDGSVGLALRTTWPRRERVAQRRKLEAALHQRTLDDTAWRALVEPWGRVLADDLRSKPLPADSSTPPLMVMALHGELQRIPLAALPTSDGGWLADRWTLALWPSGVDPRPSGSDGRVPLLVADPRGDLVGGQRLATQAQGLFPDAVLLQETHARRAALRQHLAMARWLHIDAHGRFDPAFPELSSLLLADGPLTLAELGEVPSRLDFANLSGCRTGDWVITADSGRFGFAGLLARQGARWVIASRGDLEDRLAEAYNQAFYPQIAEGRGVVEAHAQALATVRATHPATAWASLLLLRGAQLP